MSDATGYPVSGDFFTKIPYLPKAEGNAAISGLIRYVYIWNSGSVTANVTESGGDKESRPINVSVDWYIKYI